METVVLKPLQHRGQQCIGIYFAQNANLQHYIQKQAEARWSRTHKCWYVPYTQQNYGQLARALSGKAILETDALKAFVIEKKISKPLAPKSIQHQEVANAAAKKTPVIQSKLAPPANLKHQLSEENAEALQKFNQQLVLKGYSPSTIRTYTNEFMQFLNTVKNLPAYEFSTDRIKDYLQYCHTTLKLSENTLHSRMNSLKFYYEQVLKREKFFWEIPRPKKPLQLPRFFNQDEIASIIKATNNLKHKVMLMLAYSGGLRVSEVVTIKTANIDSKRMCIFIENAKGKKDRMVTLSPVLLIMLREYWNSYKPLHKGYLFS